MGGVMRWGRAAGFGEGGMFAGAFAADLVPFESDLIVADSFVVRLEVVADDGVSGTSTLSL